MRGSACRAPPEFLVSAEAVGYVTVFKAAYIERDEVDDLAARMALIVFDPQRGKYLHPEDAPPG
jgi:hypothetical protein